MDGQMDKERPIIPTNLPFRERIFCREILKEKQLRIK